MARSSSTTPPADQPPADQPPVDTPPADQPPADDSTAPPAGDDPAATPDATTAPSDAPTLDAPEQTTNPPSGTTADGSPSPAANPQAAPTARVLAGGVGVADGIAEGDKVPPATVNTTAERPAGYDVDAWRVGQAAPDDAYRVYDSAGQLGAPQSAPPGPGESGIIVARKGDLLTGGIVADLTR